MAAEWRNFTESEKEDYETMSRRDGERYAREKEAYKGRLNPIRKSPQDPSHPRPKRQTSAFLWYFKLRRERTKKRHPELSNSQVTSHLAAEWRALEDEQKAYYIKLAQQDKERYSHEIALYRGITHPKKEHKQVQRVAEEKTQKYCSMEMPLIMRCYNNVTN